MNKNISVSPRQAAQKLWDWGANITAIAEGKKPMHFWDDWQNERQTIDILNGIFWDGKRSYNGKPAIPPAQTIGVICGFAGWRCFDIDAITDDGTRRQVPRVVVLAVLAALGLPEDYPWYGRSRSGFGWHVWCRCDGELPDDIATARGSKESGVRIGVPRADFIKQFDHLELRWENCQTVLPAPTGYGEELPDVPPALVTVEQVVAAFRAIAMPKKPELPSKPPARQTARTTPPKRGDEGQQNGSIGRGGGVISAFNDHYGVEDILSRNGYTDNGRDWQHPNASDKTSYGVKLLDNGTKVYSHHQTDPLHTGHAHDAFSVYCILEHNGDVHAAVKAAAVAMGMAYTSSTATATSSSKRGDAADRSLTVEVLLEEIAQCGTVAERRLLLLDRATEVAAAFDHLALARVQIELERHDLTRTDIRRWIDLVRTEQRSLRVAEFNTTEGTDDLGHRPKINITQMDIPRIAGQVGDAMLANNEAQLTWFRWGSTLARRFTDEDGQERIERLDQQQLCSALARLCRFVRVNKERASICAPPDEIVADLTTCVDPRLPRLARVVTTPVFTADGTLIQEPGYHTASGIYYLSKPSLTIPRINDSPTHDEMEQAKRLILDELLADFPLEDDSSRAHALCLLLERFVRGMIDGGTPLYTIDSPGQGSGKGLLMQVLLLPTLGRDGASSLVPTMYEEEWRKRLTSVLLDHPEVVSIDNVVGTFESASLASAITKPVWTDRLLGTNCTVRTPISCSWIANGNNLDLGGDLARRRIPIRLVPNIPDPSKRIGFRHKLPRWAHVHRGKLIWAACTLIRYGLEHGTSSRSMGSFEEWAQVMGAILHGCDIPGFLDHRATGRGPVDPITEQWQSIVTAWWEGRGNALITTSELFDLLIERGIELPECVRGETDEQKRVSLGKQLAKIRDRVFFVPQVGDRYRRVQLQHAGKSRTGASQWRLQDISPGGDEKNGGGDDSSPAPDPDQAGRADEIPPAEGRAEGAEGCAEGWGKPSAADTALECDCRRLLRVLPNTYARVSTDDLFAGQEEEAINPQPTLCNPLLTHQNGQAGNTDPLHTSPPPAEPSAPAAVPTPDEQAAAVHAALAAGQYDDARQAVSLIADPLLQERLLAEAQAAVFQATPSIQPRHIRSSGGWRMDQQAARLIAGISWLTGKPPPALRGATLDSFAQDELFTLVKQLRCEAVAIGWKPP